MLAAVKLDICLGRLFLQAIGALPWSGCLVLLQDFVELLDFFTEKLDIIRIGKS